MSPNFQSLCYLAAWEKGLPLEGGMAWESQLRKCRLDYSWASLERIDYFLDALRKQRAPVLESFLLQQANVNLLIFMAFYVGELRSRVSKTPVRWFTYQDALEKDPSVQMYGPGFHSSLVLEHNAAHFLPLVSICARLFENAPDKGVVFSAGLNLQPPADKHQCQDSLILKSMIPGFSEKYQASAIPIPYKRWIESPIHPELSDSDALVRLRADAPKLLRSGIVVWGAVVQANGALFDPSFLGCAPGEVVYDPQGKVERMDLYEVARRLHELSSEEQIDPDLEIYGKHLRAETSRIFAWRTPPSLYPYELLASTTLFSAEIGFPGYALVSPLIPILVSEECPGSIVIAPWQLWPKEVFEEWNEMLRGKFGEKAIIKSQIPENPVQKIEPEYSLPAFDVIVEDEEDELGSPWLIIGMGVFMFLVAWLLYSTLSDLERSGGSMRIHVIVVLLYNVFGKTVASGLFVFMGIVFSLFGIRKLVGAK